ncbi:GNAT family N-acetyltransferase [Clostridium estertheticum]|uniref:GNAT family N-acetyltransferase n=1 Tax=Clostridium estertheticum TaxID=238834 RepID=UPI0013E93945|nr:GNAT family N-acetyltransferase [Clostridium estertheticum]MBZ9687336.1 GNAT family N-acetyltransferase [Clostridium estertheticum]
MLNHKGTVTLETARLILRKFVFEDAENMFANWSNDAEVAKYMRWNEHNDINETKKNLRNRIEKYQEPSTYYWAIIMKTTNNPIGNIALITSSEYDMCADVAYCIGRGYWGQGIATEALKRVLEFGLAVVNFNRIEAYHSVNNIASGRAMQKAGMKYEGRMRQKYRSHVGFEDSDLYAILKEDLSR